MADTNDEELEFLCAMDITPPPSPDRSRREEKLFLSEEKFEEQKRGWRPKGADGNAKERAERCYYLRDWRGAVEAVAEALGEERWGAQERGELERVKARAEERMREGR
jgi:hypothetical protein